MDSLGFIVHLEKSVLIPTKRITFLGFLLCSETMTVTFTQERVKELLDCCSTIFGKTKCPIRQFAKMIEKMVVAEPGVGYTPLYYKPLEKVKDLNFRKNKGDFDRLMRISRDVGIVIKWWLTNLTSSFKAIMRKAPEVSL